jgi:nucleotide-sensitive chloride channel 1A
MPAVTFIDAIPNHISEEDHRTLTGATPASFADIPPVLRHKVNDVAVAFDPPLDGFSGEDSARGTLYIIERYAPRVDIRLAQLTACMFVSSVLAFQSSTTGRAFQIEYQSITLHAISRGESGPFVYCQLDDSPAVADGSEDAGEDVPPMRELSLTPQPSDSRASPNPIFSPYV